MASASQARSLLLTGARWLGGLIAVLVLLLIFVWPALMLAVGAFRSGSLTEVGNWTLEPFLRTLGQASTWKVTGNSLILAVAASFGGLALGTFLAWVAVRTTTPLRRYMTPLMALILVIPPLFYGLGWVLMLSGKSAPVNLLMHALFGVEESLFASGWPTLILIVTGFVVPVGYLFMVGPVGKIDSSAEDAARMSGAGRATAFFTITLPLLRPTMFGVFVLMTSYAFSAFELPLLFGMPDDIYVFSTAVYSSLTASAAQPDYAGASTLSLILMVLVVLLVAARKLVTGRRQFTTVSGKSFRAEARDYGRIQWLFLAVFLVTIALSGVIPIIQMVVGSFQPMFGVSGGFTTANYETVLKAPRTGSSIVLTLVLALIGGLIASSIALVLSHLAARGGKGMKFLAGLTSWAPVAIPGVLIGLALISAYLPIPGLRTLIGTPVMLLLGFIVVVTPIATRAVEGGVLQISVELEESARISGASRLTTFFTIVLPLVLSSFLAGWVIAGVGIAGNLSLPVLLSSPTMQTVAVGAYSLYREGYASQAAAAFVLLMAAVLLTAAALGLLFFAIQKIRRAIQLKRLPSMKLKGES